MEGNVAACHAGWRGIAKGILTETVAKLKKHGAEMTKILISFGPCISSENYPVGPEVIQAICAEFRHEPKFPNLKDTPSSDLDQDIFIFDNFSSKYMLDIRKAAAKQLKIAGITDQQINICPICTFSEPRLFSSWRRDKVRKAQWSTIISNN